MKCGVGFSERRFNLPHSCSLVSSETFTFLTATTANSNFKPTYPNRAKQHKAVSVNSSSEKPNKEAERLGHVLTCSSFKAAICHKVPATVRDMIHLPPRGGDGVEHLLLSRRLVGDT